MCVRDLLERPYVDSLQPFGPALNRELDTLVLLQRTEPVTLDSGKVNEHVIPATTRDKAVSLGVAEPFNGSSFSFSHFFLLLEDVENSGAKQWG
jgi:hypothetical protein